MKNKKQRILKKIMLACLIIVVLELMIMLIMKISQERNIDRINVLNSVIKTSNGYVMVGESDFHNSNDVNEKHYEFKNSQDNIKQKVIATQARVAKYDSDMNLLWERTYDDTKYDSTYYDLVEVDDGFIVVGSVINEYKQIEDNTRDAIIVKYDNDGKVVWKNTYTVLSDTEFYKIIKDEANYVVIGQSIFGNMEMSPFPIIVGGGIIVKYNSDGEEIAHNNYGGNKSGNFNDIIKVNDGYIVCGKDAANYGIVVKFKKDFNRDDNDNNLISKKVMWQRTYANTDEKGFNGITMIDDTIYAVGTINISNEKDYEGNTKFKYDAGMVMYSKDGKYLGKYNLDEDTHHRLTNVLSDDKYLYLSMDLDVENKDGQQVSKLITFDPQKKKIIKEYAFYGTHNTIIKRLINIDNKHMYVGTTNNSCSIYGCDYENLYGYIEKLKASEK